jgi:hypothetical protein
MVVRIDNSGFLWQLIFGNASPEIIVTNAAGYEWCAWRKTVGIAEN